MKIIKQIGMITILFLATSQLCAKSENQDFEKLYQDLNNSFINSKYSEALVVLEKLKVFIERKKEIQQDSILSNQAEAQDFEALFKKTKSPAKFYVGKEEIKVHYGRNILYVIKNNPDSYFKSDYLYSGQLPVEFNGKLPIQNKYCKIDNQTKILKFKSNNKEILSIESDGRFYVKKSGNVIITISVDDYFTQIPLKIIEIPLHKGMSKEKVIEILGLPDKENKKYIEWTQSTQVDGIFYYANTNDASGISVEHWIYNKYPNAILMFGYSDLSGCDMADWKGLSALKYSLEHN